MQTAHRRRSIGRKHLRDSEDRWARRWLWLTAAVALISFAVPGLYPTENFSSGRAPAVTTERPDGGPLQAAWHFLPLAWAVLAVLATRFGWGMRTALLGAGVAFWPILNLVSELTTTALFPTDTLSVVIESARHVLTGLALGLISAIAHGQRKQLAGRSYRWMAVAVVVLGVSLAERLATGRGRYGAAFFIHEIVPGLEGRNIHLLAEYIAGLVELSLYSLYLALALGTGLGSSAGGRRIVSIASRCALFALPVFAVPWDALSVANPTAENTQYALTWAVKNGGLRVAEILVTALAVACWLEYRKPDVVQETADAFA